eukprot:jgi/Mesen1/5457/ME000273S04696
MRSDGEAAVINPEIATNSSVQQPGEYQYGHTWPERDNVGEGGLQWPADLESGSKCVFRHTNGRWYSGFMLPTELVPAGDPGVPTGVGAEHAQKEASLARVAFLTPTSEHMRLCDFFVRQSCRFGDRCRSSHGVLVPRATLQPYVAPDLLQVPEGASVLVCTALHESSSGSGNKSKRGLWQRAELERRNEIAGTFSVSLVTDGSRVDVRPEHIALSQYAAVDNEGDSNDAPRGGGRGSDCADEEASVSGSGSDQSERWGRDGGGMYGIDDTGKGDANDYEAGDSGGSNRPGLGGGGLGSSSGVRGGGYGAWKDRERRQMSSQALAAARLGAEEMALAGPQSETVQFASWEQHTRGVASKIMAGLGFREGMGLGSSGQGIVDPVLVRAFPSRRSLDYIGNDGGGEGARGDGREGEEEGAHPAKKRRRGGERSRRRAHAAAKAEAKAEEEKEEDAAPNVFDFINVQLAARLGDGLHSVDKWGASYGDEVESKSAGGPVGREKPVGKTRRSHDQTGGPSNGDAAKKEGSDRRALVAQAEELNERRVKVARLEEMAARNKGDRVMHAAVMRKLEESRRALAKAEGAHASSQAAVQQKERTTKWMKF